MRTRKRKTGTFKKALVALSVVVASITVSVAGYAASGELIGATTILSQEQVSLVQCEPAFQLIRPLDGGYISSPYARRWGSMHTGVDIAAPKGTPIYASEEGVVTLAGWSGSYGRCVLIDHENGVVTRYAHQSKIIVKVGQRVEQGQIIGYVGSTGRSTGPHLHFEIIENGRTVNPTTRVDI